MPYLMPASSTAEWLERALQLETGQPTGVEMHVAVLQHLDRGLLVRLDAALRHHGAEWKRSPGAAHDVVTRLTRNVNPECALFVLGCNANGYVREAALRAMQATPGGAAMSLALLRADDHVAEVRAAAMELVSTVLREAPGYHLFDNLELILSLRARERFGANAWQAIEQALLDPRGSEDRSYATRAGAPVARRYAWTLIAQADPDVIDARLVDAVRDPDAGVAHWALERAMHVADWRDIAAVAGSHPQASVRAASLRLRVAREGDAALPDLEPALFDRAQTVRLAASYLLRGHVDAIARWRAAADGANEPARAIAMAALADLAMREDETRMLAALSHPLSVVRGMALSALVRMAPDAADERIERATADVSPRVARIAYRLARKRSLRLSPELLDARFMQAANRPARARVIANVDLAGKWESLALLLHWCVTTPLQGDNALQPALYRWLLLDARVQSAVPPHLRSPLTAAITRARFLWPRWDATWDRLTFALRTNA